MQPTRQYSKRFLPVLIFFLAVLARVLPGPRTIDDSYITFRYARNILAGNGFTYNPGEHVLGTTTPLYTFLLTASGGLTGGTNAPFPILALTINALADGLTCVLLYQLGKHLKSPLAGTAASLAWSVAPFSVTFAIGGLETSVYVLLLTAVVFAHISGRRVWAALLAALALLTRPDALILLGLIGLDRILVWLADKRGSSTRPPGLPWSEVCAFFIPTLAWIVFSTFYFGSPLPHSIAAKSLAYHLPGTAALVRLLQHYATPFLEHLSLGIPAIGVGMFLYPVLFIIGARSTLPAAPRAWPFMVYPWAYFLIFSIANPLIFRWYLTPPLPAYFLFILVGVEKIISASLKIQPSSGKTRRFALFTVAGLLIFAPAGLMLRDWKLIPDHGLQRPAPEMAWYQLELLYRQAADSLAADIAAFPRTPVLAAGDVGVLGFYTSARILDTVGLNSPVSTSYYPLPEKLYTINYAIAPDLIIDEQPDFLVFLEVYGREGLLKDPRFITGYRLRQKIPTDIYSSDGMLIYERLDD